MEFAPIALFAFNRPDHLRRCVEALLANPEAPDTDLVVFSDGPRSEPDEQAVAEVRAFARGTRGFRSVEVVERDENVGGPVGIPMGITSVVERYGRVVVVEDDIVVAPAFLSFVNASLGLYEDQERVMSVCGYTFPHRGTLPPTFFLRGALNQGWATWSRAWAHLRHDGLALYEELRTRGLIEAVNRNAYPYAEALRPRDGRAAPWDVRWYASTFLLDGLCLLPGESLVRNIGFDGSGTHVGVSSALEVPVAQRAPVVERIAAQSDPRAEAEFRRFLRRQAGWRYRLRFGLR